MAQAKRNLTVGVISEKETMFYGECNAVTVPTTSDSITILPFHTPLIAKLGKGQVVVHEGHTKKIVGELEGGLVYVGDNEVTILINL